jgi:hypothetical protein
MSYVRTHTIFFKYLRTYQKFPRIFFDSRTYVLTSDSRENLFVMSEGVGGNNYSLLRFSQQSEDSLQVNKLTVFQTILLYKKV